MNRCRIPGDWPDCDSRAPDFPIVPPVPMEPPRAAARAPSWAAGSAAKSRNARHDLHDRERVGFRQNKHDLNPVHLINSRPSFFTMQALEEQVVRLYSQ